MMTAANSSLHRILGAARKRPVRAVLLAAFVTSGLLVWNSTRLSVEERRFVGRWYDARPDGNTLVVEFHADRTVTRSWGSQEPRSLGSWRVNGSRIQTYSPLPFVTWNNGPAAATRQMWTNTKRYFSSSQDATINGFLNGSRYSYEVEPMCDGGIVLDEMIFLGCGGTPQDDERFARTLEEAIERDRLWARNNGVMSLACETPEASSDDGHG